MVSKNDSAFEMNLLSEEIRKCERQLGQMCIILLDPNDEQSKKTNSQINHRIFVGFFTVIQNIHVFNDVDMCFAFIKGESNQNIVLLLSTALSADLMHKVYHDYPQILFVYQLNLSNPLIKGDLTIGNENPCGTVEQRIHAYHRLMNNDLDFYWTSEYFPNTNSNRNTLYSRKFFEYLFLLEIVFHLHTTSNSLQEFVDYSREYFRDDQNSQRQIDRFANEYSSDTSVRWYTKQAFLYHIIKKVFLKRDINAIFTTRHFSIDLYKELKELHVKYKDYFNKYIEVYRGKRMTREEFQQFRASIGELIINTGFLSTSLDSNVASFYVSEGSVGEGYIAVIIQLVIDTRVNSSRPFAYIGDNSDHRSELEFLLPPGMIFKNRAIKLMKENLYTVTFEQGPVEVNIHSDLVERGASYLSKAQDVKTAEEFLTLTEQAQSEFSRNIQQNWTHSSATSTDTSAASILNENDADVPESSTILTHVGFRRPRCILSQMYQLRDRMGNQRFPEKYVVIKDLLESDVFTSGQNNACSMIVKFFPTSEIYNVAAYSVETILLNVYPFVPPSIRFLTPIYHPNVAINGIICLPILSIEKAWRANKTLKDCMDSVFDCFQDPDPNYPLNPEAAREYIENFDVFKEKARAMAIRHGLPRTIEA